MTGAARELKVLGRWDDRKFLLVVCVLAVALRLFAVAVFDLKGDALEKNFRAASGMEPYDMARSLIAHGQFELNEIEGKPIPTANQPPVYPLLIAASLKLFPTVKSAFVAIQVFNVLVGSLVPLLSWLLARRFFGDAVGRVAAILTCVWPLIVYMPVEPHSITLGLAMTLLAGWFYARLAFDDAQWKEYAWAGAITGFCVLVRSELAVLGPILFLAILLRRNGGMGWRGALIFTLCASVFVVPWMVRNQAVLGKASLSTTMFLNLYRGNSQTSTGGSYKWDGSISWGGPSHEEFPELDHWSSDYELKMEKAYQATLKKELKDNPGILGRVMPNKLLFFWVGDLTHPKGKQLPSVVLHVMASLGAFVGFWVAWKKKVRCWPAWFWILLYQVVVLIFFALPRYRLNVEPFILIFAALGLVWLWTKVRQIPFELPQSAA